MARFCTRCGNPLDDADRYCDQCGAALGGTAPSPVPPPARAPRMPRLGRKQWLGIAGASVLVLALGGGAFWYLAREAPLPEAAEIDKLLPGLVDVDAARCLSNFDYTRDPVYVNVYDNRTRTLLDVLVGANIYLAPAQVTQQEGYFRRDVLEYRHGAEAARYIKGGKLCFADGITVDHVDFSERVKNYKFPLVRAHISYKLLNPAAWATTGKAAAPGSPFRAQQKGDLAVVLKHDDGKWTPLSSAEQREAMIEMQRQARQMREAAKPSGGGLFSFLKGNPGRPIFGTWRSSNAMFGAEFEFTEHSVFVNGQQLGDDVSYANDGDDILVSAGGDKSALRVTPKSSDEITIIMYGQRITLQRKR